MLRVVVNRRPYELPEGQTILEALRSIGIHLPTLCHDDRLAPMGGCRLCVVHVSGLTKAVTACTTPLFDGMEIATEAPDLEQTRRSLLEMLVRRYPTDAIRRFPDKPFHRLLTARGLDTEATGCSSLESVDSSHPYIRIDMTRCVDCYRCVRICDELQGQSVWHVRGRGPDIRLQLDGPTLRDSSCVSCGACADTCPTGAIEDRTMSALSLPSQWTRTVCPYCGVGCELSVGTRGNRIVSVKPVLDAPVNKGHLCVKGRYAFEFVAATDRITEPMIRAGDEWRRVSWNEARAVVAERFRELKRHHGADSIAILGSARATNEDNYVAQKFARAVLGTNNVDCCARVCHAPSAMALKHVLGTGLATNSFDDIERARTLLVCGANPTESHAVIGARIKQAVRRGAHLIVIDPRRIELAEYADHHLAIRPGTNVPLLNAMAHTIVDEGLADRAFIAQRVAGFDGFVHFVQRWSPERAGAICGVEAELIRRAARLYASQPPAMSVHGLGLTEHVQGTDGVRALINLALLTGNIGSPGAGVNPLRGQNNVQGAAHMGCDPDTLPGSTPLDRGRDPFEGQWGVELPLRPGLNLLQMMDAALEGRVKGLWTIGYDVLLTNPNATETARALRSLEVVIVQDMFLTETARQVASIFLPACSSFEKDGTFMNAERRIQRVRAALRPAGSSKPDWQIMCEVARSMGAPGFDYTGPEAIWNEVRTLCEGARGMSYARLDEGGLQWPCPTSDHPGTPMLHGDTFPIGARAQLETVDYRPTPEETTEAFPFRLVTGRSLYQFNAGTMTGRTPNMELRPTDLLDISPIDASSLTIVDGDSVRVISRYGAAVLTAHVDAAIQRGQLFATFQRPEILLNALTGPNRDDGVGTPEYKLTAVRLERLAA